jgi:hypothetical protein
MCNGINYYDYEYFGKLEGTTWETQEWITAYENNV